MSDRLTAALQLWRSTHDPDAAYLVEVFGRLDATELPLGNGRRARDHEVWLEIAANARDADMTALLDRLDATSSGEEAHERLTAILKRGPDPRLIHAMLRWIEAPRYRSTPELWDAVFEHLAAHAPRDVDLDALADRILRADQTHFAIDIAADVRRLELTGPEPVALSDEQRAQVAGWLDAHPRPRPAAVASDRPSVDHLLELVRADPDDDGPREVLADLWTELGDPRGRFVRLQLERARREAAEPWLAPEPRTEELALLREHEGTWFGPWLVAMRSEGRSFDRRLAYCSGGFPHDLDLFQRMKHLAKLTGSPDLATVRHLGLPHARSRAFRSALPHFLAHPVMAALRRVSNVQMSSLPSVLEACPQVEEIAFFSLARDFDEVATLVSGAPGRRYALHVRAEQVGALRVEELVVLIYSSQSSDELAAILRQCPPEVRRLWFVNANEAGLALERTDAGWQVRLRSPRPDVHGWSGLVSLDILAGLVDRGAAIAPDPAAAPAGEGSLAYYARRPEPLEWLSDLPPAPVHLAYLAGPDQPLPDVEEVWVPLVERSELPRAKVVGVRFPSQRPLARLLRRDDGRVDARVCGAHLEQLIPFADRIARVIGWGPEVEAWCAERGLPRVDP